MLHTPAAPAHQGAVRVRANRLLAVGLAAVVAAEIGFADDDPHAPAKRDTDPSPPMIFGDPPVSKGARGGDIGEVPVPVFRDPMVRKGAG